jgi:uncharacterized protein (TIGR02996 family)
VTTTDPTLKRLLGAVLADPADDTARMVLADALEERGDGERAEFIRDQTEWRPGSADIDYLDANLEAWCPWFGRHPEWGFVRHNHYGLMVTHAGGQVTMWSKGFVAEVRCTLADYEAHAAALFAAQPIERVTLTDREPYHNAADCWLWQLGWLNGSPQTILPKWLLTLCEGDIDVLHRNSFRTYRTRLAALDALGAALVMHGRRLARIDVPCGPCDGSGTNTPAGLGYQCEACKGTGWVLNTDG